MPVVRSRSGVFQIASPGHATSYRLAQWLGEISGEILALDRSQEFLRRTARPNFLFSPFTPSYVSGAEHRLSGQRSDFEQFFGELRGVLLLPGELQIPPILGHITDCLARVSIGLFRHPDDPPWAEGEEIPDGDSTDEATEILTRTYRDAVERQAEEYETPDLYRPVSSPGDGDYSDEDDWL